MVTPYLEDLVGLGGLHSPAEAARLALLAAGVPDEWAIIEIGSYVGASGLALVRGSMAGSGARVVCIDPWPQPHPKEPDIAHADRQRHALGRFLENMSGAGWPLVALRGRSADVARMWLQPVGLAFIDGDHSYRAVLEDVTAWARHIPSGGWLALHDFLGDHGEPTEVAAVAGLLVASHQWEAVATVDKMWTARRR